MESSYVTLPCDRSDWIKIISLIRRLSNVRSIDQALKVLLTIFQQVHGTEEATIPHGIIEEYLRRSTTKEEKCRIVQKIFPIISNAAESLKELKQKNEYQLCQEKCAISDESIKSTAVDHDLLLSLVAHCVLCTIPLSKQVTDHPLITFLSRPDGQLSRQEVADKLRCVFKLFEEINDRESTSSLVVYKQKVHSGKEQMSTTNWLGTAVDHFAANDESCQQKIKPTEHIDKCICLCPLLLPTSLFIQPISVHHIIEISGVDYGVLVKGHLSTLTIGELTGKPIGLEERDSIYHDAIDQSDVSVESDYETAPESHENLSTYELVSGYSNSLSKAITNCAIYDAVRSKKLRRDSDDSRSSQNSSNSSNRSNPREHASFSESAQITHNLAQYYCQDTDRLHVNLLRRRSSNELSSHHSTSLSEFGSEMDEYFGKKISAITEDDSQPHVEDYAANLASSVVSHSLHTASSLLPGIQQFEAKQPENVAMRPIPLRPTPESITPELSSDGDYSSQRNSIDKFAQNIVDKSLSMIFRAGDISSVVKNVDGVATNGFGSDRNEKISNKIERLASCLVEKLIDDVMHKKKKSLKSAGTGSSRMRNIIFDEQERACFAEAVDQLAGRVLQMAVQDAQDVINERLDVESYGSINEDEYSIISPMSSMKGSDSYEIIKLDSVSEASSSPVIVTKKNFPVEESVEKILNESLAEPKLPHFDVTQFAKLVVDAALQKIHKLKCSNGSNQNLGDIGCLATCSTVNCDQSKVNNNELLRQNHKLELPEPSANMVHDKVCEGNLISVQEMKGRNVRCIDAMFDRNLKAPMSDTSENRLSGESSGPIPGTPPPTPDSLTKNNFDITENTQHALEEELRKRFAEEESKPKCKITSIDSLASKLASAAVNDGIHKVCRREKKPSTASTFTEDLLKIGNIDITGKQPSCTEENIAMFREELRRASIEQEREMERRGSQLSDFADELESAKFKEDLQEIPNHIQDFAYDLANNILASAFRQQFENINKTEQLSESVEEMPTQQSVPMSLDPAAQERNLLAMATNLANSIVASALQALRDGQATGRSREQPQYAETSEPETNSPSRSDTEEVYSDPQMKPMMLWLSASYSQQPGASSSVDKLKLRKVCRNVLERGWDVGDLSRIVKDYTELPQADKSEELFDYILRISQT